MASPGSIAQWDDVADVVIAGYGLAGACAAIEAHDADPSADVLIVEKATRAESGGNTRASGQALLVPTNATALADYQRRLGASNPVPEEMLREWARRMCELEPWIEARCAESGAQYVHGLDWSGGKVVREFPDLGADEAVARITTILPMPSGVWLAFTACVERRPRIRVRHEARLVDLVQDPDTLEIFGAIVETGGRRLAIRARGGVVLATGGFENDPAMRRNYAGTDVHPLGSPHATGDGLRVLQKAGAEMWHLRNACWSGGVWPGFRFPGQPTAFLRQPLYGAFGWVDVAEDSRRFCDETAEYVLTHYKQRAHGVWRDAPYARVGRMHMVFDEGTRVRNRLGSRVMTWNAVAHGYRWSDDNSAELDRGWIARADSIEDLARTIDRDPAALRASVERYNAACALGRDDEFGRDPSRMSPIVTPPYHAIELVPAIVCTSGGAMRSIESEVLRPDGVAIAGLYEAGELGSMISGLYQNGAYLTEAMISGRAAGGNAVRRAKR